ncbi:hypothetical protein GQ43DRAFT_444796 [Delitschia confertaspora ATCC 74209]|uniref:UBC core domain-containing protein n=1 Tax=Delitschia confertaspora ATCC 74209 TaxID=1513339 RepID=A0A9P4JHI3_9PLEO|nr:hypothetical protein GQ43DRAFT_444796 [Delitschia confertaspora ATCC 74209]
MPLPDSTPALLSFRKQNLLVEFSSLRYAQLDGVFVSITPGDPSLWVGVLFVQKGPYSSAVLRFQISFPASYPTLPPLVTFSTDVFHPLLTPLTTYTYTTGSSDTDTVSATDEERLPPGGFSLRHGFPHWFGRSRKFAASSRNVSASGAVSPAQSHTPVPSEATEAAVASADLDSIAVRPVRRVAIVKILEYIRSTFTDETVLDSIPLEAAANPGAYHAWRAHRASHLGADGSHTLNSASIEAPTVSTGKPSPSPALGINRRPEEWNWEGVWEERVKKAIRASLSEPVLYNGTSVGEDLIQFRDTDEESVKPLKEWESISPSIRLKDSTSRS